jgi:hypothetical protein
LASKKPCDLCCGKLCFLDQGICVKLIPKSDEEAIGLALDGCLFADKLKKCDGLFVLRQARQIFIALIELKATHVEDAYAQVAYVRDHRREYVGLVEHLSELVANRRQIRQQAFIITTSAIDRRTQQKLENSYKIRPRMITLGKPVSSAPDLRAYLR